MAIIKDETMPNGVPLSYWRIVTMTVIVNQQVTVEIAGYVSEEARKAEQDAMAEAKETGEYPETDIYIESRFIEFPYDPDMSVTKAYALIKGMEEFADATDVIDLWSAAQSYYVGDAVMHEGKQYECIQSHDSQTGWEPPNAPALWKLHSSGEIPEWVQPTGAQDAYAKGDHVMHNGKEWESLVDGNVWEPGATGTEALWEEV